MNDVDYKESAFNSILIVDDEPNNIQLLGSILKNEGFTVEFAMDGEEAMDWVCSSSFDLILLDVNMPDMNGYEVCKKIREIDHLKEIPIIFLSALKELEDKIRGFEVGGNDYVTKPFHAEEVKVRIRNHLQLAETRHSLSEAVAEKEHSNLLMNAIIQGIPETLIAVDKDFNLLSVNRIPNPICDKPTDSVETLQKVFKDKDDVCHRVIKDTFESGAPVTNRMVFRADSKKRKRTISLSTIPLAGPSLDFQGTLLIVNDITRLTELEAKLQERQGFRNIIGKSESMQKIYALLEQIADVETSVLIFGESGTGKELIAEALHYGSSRSKGPLIKVNCAALSESLLESELFGHVKGAFTGAIENRIGRFQAADQGTIFLDEIGDISPQMQVKLLRVLEQKEFERIGESKTNRVNVRVVAATNVDLREKIEKKAFREDLYYRLKGMLVELPPLRKRTEDIPLLCQHFFDTFNKSVNKPIEGFLDQTMHRFLTYPWPGNIRELRNAVEHACILCSGTYISLEHIPKEIAEYQNKSTESPFLYASKLKKEVLIQTLEANRWNKAKTAKALGIGRNTLYRYMEKHGID